MKRDRRFLIPLVVALLILLWGASRPPAYAYDDAYITFRYADNLRDGLGLVYNPGQPVLGTTTPFFALLLGALGLLVPNLEWLGHWLGVLAWIGAAWAALALFWHAKRPFAGGAAALLIALQPSLLASLGMETPLLIALMLAVAWAWLDGRRAAAVILGAALLLTRQDSALWLLLLGLEVWRRDRRLPWREAAGVALLAAPWLAFAWLRYGSPLPNSATAKVGQNALMPVAGQAPFPQMFLQSLTAAFPFPVSIALLAAAGLGLWIVTTRLRRFWWLPAWLIVYLATYTGLNIVSFPWYFVPPATAVLMLAGLGMGALFGDGRPRVGRVPAAAGMILLLLLAAGSWPALGAALQTRGHRPAYRPAGEWLAVQTPAGSVIATIEIGVIGYLSDRPILDTMGLVSLDLTDHQFGWRETLVYALGAHRPDYVVALPNTAWDWVTAQWWFADAYQPVARFDELTIFGLAETPDRYQATATATFEPGIALTAVVFDRQTAAPGEVVTARAALEVLAPPPGDLLLTATLIEAATGRQWAATTVEPFDGGYPARYWQPGDQLAVPLRVALPSDAPPGVYRLGLLLYDAGRGVNLPLRAAPGAYPQAQAGWLRVAADQLLDASGERAERPLAGWQNGIELAAVSGKGADGALSLALTWGTTAVPERDLTVFVHLLNETGEIVAQADRRPLDGRFPTPAWLPGDRLRDQIEIALPDGLPDGGYDLRLGLYDGVGRVPLIGGADGWTLPEAVVLSAGDIRFQGVESGGE